MLFSKSTKYPEFPFHFVSNLVSELNKSISLIFFPSLLFSSFVLIDFDFSFYEKNSRKRKQRKNREKKNSEKNSYSHSNINNINSIANNFNSNHKSINSYIIDWSWNYYWFDLNLSIFGPNHTRVDFADRPLTSPSLVNPNTTSPRASRIRVSIS